MLKVRLIPTLLHSDFVLVKGVRFDSWRNVGSLLQAIKVYTLREVDELVFLDIVATRDGRGPDFGLIEDIADHCFMPLTVGGGVRNVEDVRRLLQVGADKIALNTAAIERPGLIAEIANGFGSQCVVVSLDVKRLPDGSYELVTHAGKRPTGLDPFAFAREAEALGAGELLLTSIDRDGTMDGYDLDLIQRMTKGVSIPVIASGGAGHYEHLAQAVRSAGASAVAMASMFHFTEQTPREAKEYLHQQGIPVRL